MTTLSRLLAPLVGWVCLFSPVGVLGDDGNGKKPADAKPVDPKTIPARDLLTFEKTAAPFLAKYCLGCHGSEKPKGDLNLASFKDEESVLRGRKLWLRLQEYVESGDMPPEGKPKPTSEEAEAFNGWLHGTLSKVNCSSQTNPGRVTIRRLNRSEYNNTIRDLIGIDFRPADDFPSDDVGYGFDNIGDVLTLPPILLEKYLEAAERIAGEAIVATPVGSPGPIKTYEAEELPDNAGGSPYKEDGRMLTSLGTINASHVFPRDGEYILRARAYGQQAGPEMAKMAFVVDGKPLKSVDVKAVEKEPGIYEHRAKLRGGTRQFGVSFLNDFYDDKNPDPNQRDRNLVVDYLEVQGPVQSANAPLPASHKKIIYKTATKQNRADVANEILTKFASKAYRRPVAAGEVARLMKFVDLAATNGDSFERGIQLAVEAILVSPQFLFRVELDQRPKLKPNEKGKATDSWPINDFELASRLSYFLWSSLPDDELNRLALDQKLHNPEVLEKQVKRMLRDPKAHALVENFADQWLQIRNLKLVNPDRGRFPSFDDGLRNAMMKETELFIAAIIREDRSILELIDSDFTFLNERMAKHYGIDDVQGDNFRRVKLGGGRRGGILTQARILTVTSNPTRTSPVKRGKWILEQILGTPPPAPPPNIPDLKDDKGGELKGTLRQRMEQHRANPSCATCHARMDPLGFGFENFDAIGAWREKDGDTPVDPSGLLPSGQTFQGPKELKTILKARDKDFANCLAEKLLTYAIGRGLEYYDGCAVDKIVEETARDHYRFSRMILEVVRSDPFQKRKAKGDSR